MTLLLLMSMLKKKIEFCQINVKNIHLNSPTSSWNILSDLTLFNLLHVIFVLKSSHKCRQCKEYTLNNKS